MAAHRYWKLNVTQVGADIPRNTVCCITDLQLSIDYVNQCGSGTASASSVYGTQTADLAFDASSSTYWRSNTNVPVWIKYDFGSGQEKDINGYRIRPYSSLSDTSPRDWTLEFSDDNTNWTVFHTVTDAMLSATGTFIYPMVGRIETNLLRTDPFFGNYRIVGTVTELGVAGPYRVRLFARQSGLCIRETVSAADGSYTFDSLAYLPNGYFAIAYDHGDNPLNAAIADLITPEAMP